MKTLLNRFNDRIKEINKDLLPKDGVVAEKYETPVNEQLYSIYKRSLPVGVNKPVRMNLTLEDAKRALTHLETKEKNDVVIYYDIVAQFDNRQQSPFFNEGPIQI